MSASEISGKGLMGHRMKSIRIEIEPLQATGFALRNRAGCNR